jgi:hypothetical protein
MTNRNDQPDRPDHSAGQGEQRAASRPMVQAPSIFTIHNAVLIALLQVAMVVFGSLGAAMSFRLTSSHGGPIRLPTLLLLDYWLAFMALPLVWITTALMMRRSPDVSFDAKGTVFWLGVVLLAGLAMLGLCGFLGPLALDGLARNLPAANSWRS